VSLSAPAGRDRTDPRRLSCLPLSWAAARTLLWPIDAAAVWRRMEAPCAGALHRAPDRAGFTHSTISPLTNFRLVPNYARISVNAGKPGIDRWCTRLLIGRRNFCVLRAKWEIVVLPDPVLITHRTDFLFSGRCGRIAGVSAVLPVAGHDVLSVDEFVKQSHGEGHSLA